MIRTILLVGIGGFIGSVSRYLSTHFFNALFSSPFPFGTVIVNIIGSFLIGLIFGLSERFAWLTPEWRFFLAAGFCGGFTTFSAFSYESMNLLRQGEWLYSAGNIVLSVVLCLAATFLGNLCTR